MNLHEGLRTPHRKCSRSSRHGNLTDYCMSFWWLVMSYSFCPLGSWGDRVSPPRFGKRSASCIHFFKERKDKGHWWIATWRNKVVGKFIHKYSSFRKVWWKGTGWPLRVRHGVPVQPYPINPVPGCMFQLPCGVICPLLASSAISILVHSVHSLQLPGYFISVSKTINSKGIGTMCIFFSSLYPQNPVLCLQCSINNGWMDGWMNEWMNKYQAFISNFNNREEKILETRDAGLVLLLSFCSVATYNLSQHRIWGRKSKTYKKRMDDKKCVIT